LLLAGRLQSPVESTEGVAGTPSPPLFSGALQEELVDTAIETYSNDRDRVLQACISADSSPTAQAKFDALTLVWGYVFPDTTWKLRMDAALELTKLAGTTQTVLLYLEEFKGRDDIQWPLAFSRAMIQKKAKEAKANPVDEEITDGIRQALEIAERQGDGYKDFRKYIGNTQEGSEEGKGQSQ
jgi:hypothetical protein